MKKIFAVTREGSRIFSRGGGGLGGFSKKNSKPNFDQIDFPTSPKVLKRRCFGQTFCAAEKILKKQVKKPFLGTFWKILTKKRVFFWRALPLEVSIHWRRTPFWPAFSKFCLRRRNFGQNRVFVLLWKSSQNQFGRPKKSRQNVRKFFENPPPREKPRSALPCM